MTLPPFEQIVTEHGALVLRVCRAVIGPHEAQDAWSETFLAALGAYPRLRPDSDIRAWLVTIAHRKAVDRGRATARAPLPVSLLPEADGSAAPPDDPDTELWQAVAALPDRQRGAVAYHYVADLPYAEVARLLGSSEAAARRSAADGIASLRRTLGQQNDRRQPGRSEAEPGPAQPGSDGGPGGQGLATRTIQTKPDQSDKETSDD